MGEGYFNIQLILEVIRQDLISIAGQVIVSGQSIAAIGILLYLSVIAYEGFLGGKIITMRMFRPFAIMLLLALYPQFMLVVDGMAMAVNNSLGQEMITDEYRITDILKTRDLDPETDNDDALLGIEEIQGEEGAEESDLISRITGGLSEGFGVVRWVGEKFYWAKMRFMEEILHRLSQGILLIINTLRVLFLVVLYICGPLAIGLSTFPGFESSFGSWIEKYIGVHLWLGVGSIFEALLLKLWRIIAESGGFWTSGVGIDVDEAILLTSWSWIYLLIVLVGYLTIPIVSGWIISASGIGRAGTNILLFAAKGGPM